MRLCFVVHAVLSPEDARVYTIKPEDFGCLLKFKYIPLRIDGRQGHQMTSRPFGPIVAAAAGTVGYLRFGPIEENIMFSVTSACARKGLAQPRAWSVGDASAEHCSQGRQAS